MTKIAALLVFSAMLTGCTEVQQFQQHTAQRRAQEAADYRARTNAIDDEACRSYGLVFGTAEYAQCREMREKNRLTYLLKMAQPSSGEHTTCRFSGNTADCDSGVR